MEATNEMISSEDINVVKEIRCTQSRIEKCYHIYRQGVELSDISESDMIFIYTTIGKLMNVN